MEIRKRSPFVFLIIEKLFSIVMYKEIKLNWIQVLNMIVKKFKIFMMYILPIKFNISMGKDITEK